MNLPTMDLDEAPGALAVIDRALAYATANEVVSQSRALNDLLDARLVLAGDAEAVARIDNALRTLRAAVYGRWLAAALREARDLALRAAAA